MKLNQFTRTAMIAAIYTVLCFIPGLSLISFGAIQVRIAEALALLPLIYHDGIYGVTLGCFLANLIGAATGINPTGFLDAIVGTLATFLAAECTYHLRNKLVKDIPLWSILMPVVFNFFFVGAELAVLYMPDNKFLGTMIFGAEVAVGELISVFVGYLLIRALEKRGLFRS